MRILSMLCFVLLAICLHGQSASVETVVKQSESTNFFDLKAEMDAFLDENPQAPGYKQWERRSWFLAQRLYPMGQPVNTTQAALKAYQGIQYLQPSNRATHGSWDFEGPLSGGPGLGRINCIELDPNNANVIYVGASSGGIWKSTNGGSSWSNISPHIPLLSIAGIEVDPSNSSVIYALTGDGDALAGDNGQNGQLGSSTIGVLRSTNGGATWYPTGFSFEQTNDILPIKLLMHPTDPDIQFVGSRTALHKTTDGWDTFSEVITTRTYDVEFKPGNPSIMYACGDDDIQRSTDMGENWTMITDPDFSILSNSTRIELAVSPEDPNGVYALAGNWDGLIGFYRSTSSGSHNSWQLMDQTSTEHGEFTTYCVALVADPDDFGDVYGGMQWISKSLSGGASGSWTSIVNGTVHADIHDIVMTSSSLYVACDGGIYKSTDNGSSWTDLSDGLAITEVYRIAGTPEDDNLFYVGSQDNGTYKANGSTNFATATGGDGTDCVINYNDKNIVYTSSQDGYFLKSVNGGTSFSPISVPGGDGAWISPVIMDPVDPDILFFGKSNVYRTNNAGSSYTNLGNPTSGNIISMAQGTNDRSRLYVSSSAEIYRTGTALSGSASWTDISSGLPDLFITDMVVSPTNAFRIWVTMSGYDEGDKVFYSGDAGGSWTNVSGSLPNVPVNCIDFQITAPNIQALYVGTDIGVFYKDDNLSDWIYYSNSMPAVTVNDLYINEDDNIIAAGTYGRGLWTSTLYTGCVSSVFLSDPGYSVGGVHWISTSSQVVSQVTYRFDLGTEVHYSAGQRVIMQPGFRAGGRIHMEAKIGGCPSIAVPFAPQNPSGGIIETH